MSVRDESVDGVRVLSGVGAEGRLVEALVEAGARRVLLIAMRRHAEGAARLSEALGERAAGIFTTDRPQVPQPVADAATAHAREVGADWLVSHGGGTVVGIAKAVALSLPVKIAAIPTTYAGSERTDIWGLTRGDDKITGRDARVRPALVAYDPTLSQSLPLPMSLQSLVNALSHSVEALYAERATARAREAALQSVPRIIEALRGLSASPADLEARALALEGAGLAGAALGGADMALHHKLAHVLGGLGLPHAPTHAALLPFTLAFNGPSAPEAMATLKSLSGIEELPGWLFDVLARAGLPASLEALGVQWDQLELLVGRALARRYPNPRPLTAEGIRGLLVDAWLGRRPTWAPRRVSLETPEGPHAGLEAVVAGAPLASARRVVIAVHGRGGDAERMAAQVLGFAEGVEGVSVLAPQAAARAWYPHGFRAPVVDNEPHLSSALASLDAAWAAATEGRDPAAVLVTGFSQGACLLLGWLETRAARPGAVVIFSGARPPLEGDYGQLEGVPVFMTISEEDRWIPLATFDETAQAIEAAGAALTARRRPGDEHVITPEGAAQLNHMLEDRDER